MNINLLLSESIGKERQEENERQRNNYSLCVIKQNYFFSANTILFISPLCTFRFIHIFCSCSYHKSTESFIFSIFFCRSHPCTQSFTIHLISSMFICLLYHVSVSGVTISIDIKYSYEIGNIKLLLDFIPINTFIKIIPYCLKTWTNKTSQTLFLVSRLPNKYEIQLTQNL